MGRQNENGFEVTCEGSPVKEGTNVKYLGIYLNNSMDGRSHAESLIKNVPVESLFCTETLI